MSEIPVQDSPEQREAIADNARKFIVDEIDPTLLAGDAVTSFTLTTDWLETGGDDEKKIAHKAFPDGRRQTLLIAKVTVDGKRTADKKEIIPDEYAQLLRSSIVHVKKKRYEFTLEQDGRVFDVKYDEFAGPNSLRVLEVDASTGEIRDTFDPTAFPGKLTEVIDDRSYEGYRVASRL